MKDSIIGISAIIALVALALLGCWGIVKFVNWQLDQTEIADCKRWTFDAVRMKDYYFTQWQADQCAAHNIKINAPIK